MPERRRAAIYARYSTDLQSDRSIEDQVALCHAAAARDGLTVTTTYSDRARTSASMIGRDGVQDMLADAKQGHFDVLIVEALDRLSRDQGDLAAIHKRLQFAGVTIRTCSGGDQGELQIGVHGLLGQLWMAEHKNKVRRGQSGVVRDGRHAGGRAYGYRPVSGKPGELQIVEEEAEVVRRIFEAYAAGDSPRAIAAALNAERVAAPRGARWNASTLNGNPARGHGILWNDLYRGEIVWNRVHMVMDPDTGRRVSRVNPEEEWQRQPAEHLRIVPEELWQAVRARRANRVKQGPGRRQAMPRRPLSGLLRCGVCGGGLAIQTTRGDSIWLRCSTARESGSCTNRTRPRLDRIEAAVFGRLAEELRDPVYIREYLRAYHEERERQSSAARRDKARLERAARKAKAAFQRAHDLYVQGVTDGEDAVEDIWRLRLAKDEAEAALAAAEEDVPTVELHPAAARRYIDALADLGKALSDSSSPEWRQAVETIRELISEVVVTPTETCQEVTVHGYLAALLGESPLRGQSMVAEEGLEPPTRGL